MELEDFLQQCDDLLNLRGNHSEFGCDDEDSAQEMVFRCQEIFPNTPICLVSHWCWADIEVNSAERQYLSNIGLKPTFIYSQSVIVDEIGRFPPGHQVRTSLLKEFRENCIFRTKNTCYILVGPGVQMRINIEVFSNLKM